eukprot:1416015-Prymnesium_polylepis.1
MSIRERRAVRPECSDFGAQNRRCKNYILEVRHREVNVTGTVQLIIKSRPTRSLSRLLVLRYAPTALRGGRRTRISLSSLSTSIQRVSGHSVHGAV